jgi:hypothetical protein
MGPTHAHGTADGSTIDGAERVSQWVPIGGSFWRKAITQYHDTPFEQLLRAAYRRLTGQLNDSLNSTLEGLGQSRCQLGLRWHDLH